VVFAQLPGGQATKGADGPRTARSICGGAYHAQIWAAFASPRTARPKYIGPLGWVFPVPDQNQTDSDIRRPFASGC
jgi:hypothetical protein